MRTRRHHLGLGNLARGDPGRVTSGGQEVQVGRVANGGQEAQVGRVARGARRHRPAPAAPVARGAPVARIRHGDVPRDRAVDE
jgi:hypothetical protein